MLHSIERRFDVEIFGDLDPKEVLYESSGPRIFTSEYEGRLFLVYECADDDAKYIVAPASSLIIQELKAGTRTVYDALDQPWIWIVGKSYDGRVLNARSVDGLAELSAGSRPSKHLMLWPRLMPLLSVRLVGRGMRKGQVPASVIRRAVDGPTSAIKRWLEIGDGARAAGVPEKSLRQLCDMSAQSISSDSLEISFRAPDEPLQTLLGFDTKDLATMEGGESFRSALQWAETETATRVSIDLAEAVEKLLPPMHGLVERVEIAGTLIGPNRRFVFTRETTRRVKDYISVHKKPEKLIQSAGRVGAFDKDKLTFALRDTSDGKDLDCCFGDLLYDDVNGAFVDDNRVVILGRQSHGRNIVEILAIAHEGPLAPLSIWRPSE